MCGAVPCAVSYLPLPFCLPPHCLLLPDVWARVGPARLAHARATLPAELSTNHCMVHVQAYNYETQKLAVLSQEDSAIWVS